MDPYLRQSRARQADVLTGRIAGEAGSHPRNQAEFRARGLGGGIEGVRRAMRPAGGGRAGHRRKSHAGAEEILKKTQNDRVCPLCVCERPARIRDLAEPT